MSDRLFVCPSGLGGDVIFSVLDKDRGLISSSSSFTTYGCVILVKKIFRASYLLINRNSNEHHSYYLFLNVHNLKELVGCDKCWYVCKTQDQLDVHVKKHKK